MTEPWIIICETCQTKLRVRSAEAIGSILACPKCQSFVHVVAPDVPAEPSPPPTDAGQAEAASWTSLPVKFVMAGVGVSIVVMGLLLAQRPAHDAVAGAADAASAERDVDGSSPAASDQAEMSDDTEPPRQPSSPESDEATAASDPPQDGPTGMPAEAAPPPLPALPANEGVRKTAAVRPGPAADRSAQREIPRIGLSQFDLDFSADEPSPVDAEGSPAGSGDSDSGRVPKAVTPEDRVPPPEPTASSVVRMAVERIDAGAQSQPPRNPGQALSLPLVGLTMAEADRWSPVQFARLVADMTGTAITFTPEAYLAVQHAPSRAVRGDFADATAGEVLADVLQRDGLAITQRGEHLIVSPLRDSGGKRKLVHDLDELPPQGSLAGKLRQHVTFSFTQAASLSDVLRHVERSAGLTLLVDWESLAAVGLGPASPVTASVVDQPLIDVLEGLLPQLEMDWAAVGDDALWLSARRRR